MKNNRTLIIGASIGLAVGVIMFVAALLLRGHPDSALLTLFMGIHYPALYLLIRVHSSSYDWNSLAGLFESLLAILAYWTLLGTLAGLGLRRLLTRKHHALAA
jgi:hypothetical protein